MITLDLWEDLRTTSLRWRLTSRWKKGEVKSGCVAIWTEEITGMIQTQSHLSPPLSVIKLDWHHPLTCRNVASVLWNKHVPFFGQIWTLNRAIDKSKFRLLDKRRSVIALLNSESHLLENVNHSAFLEMSHADLSSVEMSKGNWAMATMLARQLGTVPGSCLSYQNSDLNLDKQRPALQIIPKSHDSQVKVKLHCGLHPSRRTV